MLAAALCRLIKLFGCEWMFDYNAVFVDLINLLPVETWNKTVKYID
jgi:hypothetical protein